MAENNLNDEFLKTGLKVVFCGNDPTERDAAAIKPPYAGNNDKFWNVLLTLGLTPSLLSPATAGELPNYEIGLTEVAKGRHGMKKIRGAEDYDGARLRQRILQYKPRILAFNGKKAAAVYFECKPGDLEYGVHRRKIGSTEMWVLPASTSSAAAWDENIWRELAAALQDFPSAGAPAAEAETEEAAPVENLSAALSEG